MRFDHVGVNVASLDEVRDWYVGELGMEVEFEFAMEATGPNVSSTKAVTPGRTWSSTVGSK